MTFESVLFAKPDHRGKRETPEAPAFFHDLNLDQVIDAIAAGWEWKEYNLKPFFYLCPNDGDTITYRQEIMQDIESKGLLEPIQSFAQHMRAMRNHLVQAKKLFCGYRYQKERLFLDAVNIYCSGIRRLLQDLTGAGLQSRGLIAFRGFLRSYVESERFASLLAETEQLLAALSKVQDSLVIKGLRLDVRRYGYCAGEVYSPSLSIRVSVALTRESPLTR